MMSNIRLSLLTNPMAASPPFGSGLDLFRSSPDLVHHRLLMTLHHQPLAYRICYWTVGVKSSSFAPTPFTVANGGSTTTSDLHHHVLFLSARPNLRFLSDIFSSNDFFRLRFLCQLLETEIPMNLSLMFLFKLSTITTECKSYLNLRWFPLTSSDEVFQWMFRLSGEFNTTRCAVLSHVPAKMYFGEYFM